jgi:hypothetical protein
VTYNETAHTDIRDLTIIFSGATLALTNQSAPILNVGTLTNLIAGTIEVAAAGVGLNTATLDVGSGGVVDLAHGGTLDAGTTAAPGTGTITDDGVIKSVGGSGTVDGTIIGTGVVRADVGTLALLSDVTTTGLQFRIADLVPPNTAEPALDLSGSVVAGNTFTFEGPTGVLLFNNPGSESQNVVGMHVGVDNFNTVALLGDFTIVGSNAHQGLSGTVELTNGTFTDTLDLSGITGHAGGGQTWFANTDTTTNAGTTDVVLSTVVCYALGTRIGTPTGETAVENLQIGDLVLTASGAAKPVKWIGRRRIDLALHPRPEVVAPVRIQRDALAENVPHTDLLLSPDHAIFVDGKLICARQLINGTTIRQEKGGSSVEYFHVELDQHAILLAEGLPAESYLNTGNQGFFANSGAPLVLHPDLTDEADYPTRQANSCAPFVSDEASVRPVWQRLADRAAEIGEPVPQRATTTDPDLRLRVTRPHQGRYHRPIHKDDNLAIFVVPRGSREIRLLSRAQSPTETRPWLDDRRTLGVRVKRIVLRGMDELREIPMDHPDLTKGWWDIERNGQMMSRWTDGNAVVHLPAMKGPVMLEVHLAGGMIYAVEAEPESQQSALCPANVAA